MKKTIFIILVASLFLGGLTLTFYSTIKFMKYSNNNTSNYKSQTRPQLNNNQHVDTLNNKQHPLTPTTQQNTMQPSSQLMKKCTSSYNYRKHFGVTLCLLLPTDWYQKALGSETQIVFTAPKTGNEDAPIVLIRRDDMNNAQFFQTTVETSVKQLKQQFRGNIINAMYIDRYNYFLEATMTYPQRNYRFYVNSLYRYDDKHNYFWQVIFMAPINQQQQYQQIAPTIVKSFTIE